MKIQLKRSGVLDGGKAKRPTTQQTEYGELCVNYNAGDPTIFIKDSTDEIIPIAGDSHVVELIKENAQITISLGPPSNSENNDLWLDTSVCPPRLQVWSDCEGGNGQWFPLGGSEVIQFPLSISSDNGNQLNSTLTAVGGDGVSAQGNPIEPAHIPGLVLNQATARQLLLMLSVFIQLKLLLLAAVVNTSRPQLQKSLIVILTLCP